MKAISLLVLINIISLLLLTACARSQIKNSDTMKYNKLTTEEEKVIINKGTEAPFTGKYYKFDGQGTYSCKRCDAPLYRSEDKFDARCGWPSFDDEIKDAVKKVTDADGMRTEIMCAKCGAHLGHVFYGEDFTSKNTRHCVNSISLNFVSEDEAIKTDRAIFAGGCFWGTEFYFQKAEGVISTEVGYIGGQKEHPTYEEVCSGQTGHAEAVRVIFDPSKTTFEKLARLFFEIHDPTTQNRQGPDVGKQYRSAVFYLNDEQKEITNKLINLLNEKGFKVVTEVSKSCSFWVAENYHQDYYEHKGSRPYCHFYTKRF